MRVKTNVPSKRKRKRFLKEARGNYGGRRRLIRTVKETIARSRAYAYRGRKIKKRDYRSLWIIRLNAIAREHGLRYSQFIHGLDLAKIGLNRKSLSEIAINHPEIFVEIVAQVKAALDKAVKTN
jgi:large subunit ribosomal protein L20